jgi:hypothetical protein
LLQTFTLHVRQSSVIFRKKDPAPFESVSILVRTWGTCNAAISGCLTIRNDPLPQKLKILTFFIHG